MFAPGAKEPSRPKFGLKSYIVWASTTDAQGIDTGVGPSSGVADSLEELVGAGESEGEASVDGEIEGDEDGPAGCPCDMHPVRDTIAESAMATNVVRMADLRVSTGSFSPPGRRLRHRNAAEDPIAAG
ncbi:hypothetical protein BKA04_000662 [Cryobacterium mesophilum]|uniref:Uncharacterized protein n=1 Tax=Terrimesophilobacter mesophilus TaxID=433647 RepID=A0A4R8VAZ6_9MICO|nr:hypothetical protein [Terrimesophilobacter mesophilus]MBB5632439.1 hypothetical protein [Terrimesophilobacter mesophilus]TFB79270.1 hypothetical protein E3N84_03895 [Terrimesophilobacter mesophilus]